MKSIRYEDRSGRIHCANALENGARRLCLLKTSNCLSRLELCLPALFSPPMLISLATLLATLSSIFRSRAALELEIQALRHQIGVLRRSARKRPKLISGDRMLWIWCSEASCHSSG
jgi:hypothetical protein